MPVGNTFVYPIAGYPRRVKALSELERRCPDRGAGTIRPTWVVPDPAGEAGLLKLKEGAGLEATVLDIASNPRNFKIVELEAAQPPRPRKTWIWPSSTTPFAGQIGLTSTENGLFVEDIGVPYVNLDRCSREQQGRREGHEFVQSFQTDEVFQQGTSCSIAVGERLVSLT